MILEDTCIFAGTISWVYYGFVIYVISLTFIICILVLGPTKKDGATPTLGPPCCLLSCGSLMHTLHTRLYSPLKTSLKRLLIHSKFSLQLARECSEWFSTFPAVLPKEHMWKGQAESELLICLNPEQEAPRDTTGKWLYHEEWACLVANYVSKENYHVSL